jgi:bile acid:Na+ symporter, BASS family
MKRITGILTNRNFILLLSILLGLTVSNIGTWIKHLSVPALAVVMVVSLTQISFKELASPGKILLPTLYTLFFNLLIFATVMLSMAYFLIKDRELWIGFVILATAPPGVAIAPFAHITGADEKFSVMGMVGAYIASLVLIPLASLVFVGKEYVDFGRLLLMFAELIVLPIVVSQIFIRFKIDRYINRWRGTIVNWGLFAVIFTVVYLNKSVFFRDYRTLLKISLIAAVSIFFLWIAVSIILRKLNVGKKLKSSFVLASVIKNSGFSAALTLSLFGERSSLPSAIYSIFIIIFLIIIGINRKKGKV